MKFEAGEVIQVVKYDAPKPLETANRLYVHDILQRHGGTIWYCGVVAREYRVNKGVVPEPVRSSVFVTLDDQAGLRIEAFTKLLSGRTLALVAGEITDGNIPLQYILNWSSDLPGHWSRKGVLNGSSPSRDELVERAVKVIAWYRAWAVAGIVPTDLKLALNAKAAGL